MPSMLPVFSFNAQVDLLVNDFQNTLLAEQQRMISIIRVFSESTQLINSLHTNYIHTIYLDALQTRRNPGSVIFLE